jgi:uncharacterized protein YwgA
LDTRLTVLNAFLTELGQSPVIETRDDRLRVQKAVYLGQLTGVDLGYRYNWYVHGPYSPSLTQDYFALDGLSEEERGQVQAAELNSATRAKLAAARPLFNAPEGVDLPLHSWLELLSSWHYLLRIAKYPEEKASATINTQKSHVSNYINQADAALKQNGFM